MRAIRTVLMVLGAAFAVGLLLVVWGGSSALRFESEQRAFITRFTADFARSWNPLDVADRLDEPFRSEASSPHGRQVLEQFRRLGSLRSTGALHMQEYSVTPERTSAHFTLDAQFEHGEALVSIALVRRDGVVRVSGFNLHAVRLLPAQPPQAI